MTGDEGGAFEDLLTRCPVHGIGDNFIGQGKTGEGKNPYAPRGEFAGDAQIGLWNEGIVSPSEDHDPVTISSLFQGAEEIPACIPGRFDDLFLSGDGG
ncbi:MAG: hypothetical protein A4E72_02038 [Syntrophus sp. PtaU1.Bin208]|nr:MAG: hypothetical protein A4E72_02038 [Syntrophus sp. PtaU1.Bin208]